MNNSVLVGTIDQHGDLACESAALPSQESVAASKHSWRCDCNLADKTIPVLEGECINCFSRRHGQNLDVAFDLPDNMRGIRWSHFAECYICSGPAQRLRNQKHHEIVLAINDRPICLKCWDQWLAVEVRDFVARLFRSGMTMNEIVFLSSPFLVESALQQLSVELRSRRMYTRLRLPVIRWLVANNCFAGVNHKRIPKTPRAHRNVKHERREEPSNPLFLFPGRFRAGRYGDIDEDHEINTEVVTGYWDNVVRAMEVDL